MPRPKSARSHAVPAAARPDWRKHWEQQKSDAARDAWIYLMRHPGQRAYLYFSPAEGTTWGKFYIVPDGEQDQQPPGIEPITMHTAGIRPANPIDAGRLLVAAEPIPLRDQAGIRHWIEQFAQWLPMLGADRD